MALDDDGLDEEQHDRVSGLADRIADDVMRLMSPNSTEKAVKNAEQVKLVISGKIAEVIRNSGFNEKFDNLCENAIYKEDVENDLSNFLNGGCSLPACLDQETLAEAINYASTDLEESFESLDSMIEMEARLDPNFKPQRGNAPAYQEWLNDYKQYVEEKGEIQVGDSGMTQVTAALMGQYIAQSPSIATKDNTYYNIGLKQPTNGEIEPYVFGNAKKLMRHDDSAVTKQDDIRSFKFKDLIEKPFEKDSTIANPDIAEQYKGFDGLFSVDGNVASRSTVANGIELGNNVEFTRFTINEKGECGYEKIPLAHAFQDNRNNIKEHIEGPADKKAQKVAQDITEKLKISTEKKRLAYLNDTKKAEANSRKQIIKNFKDQIKNTKDKQEKNNLKKQLKAVQDNFKKADRAMKPLQKAAEKQCKNNIKKYEKERKDRIKADAKAERDRIKAERARQKAAEKAAKRNGGQPQAAMQEPLVAAEAKPVNRISIRQRTELQQEVSAQVTTSRTGQRTAAPTTDPNRTRQSEVTSQRNGH